MANKRVVETSNAPQNDNPYSQGILTEGLLFVSGQGPTNPSTGEEVRGGIEAQTDQTLANLQTIIESAGGSLNDVVKVSLYLADISDYDTVNTMYGQYFNHDPPARVCVEVARLPGDINIEIEAFASIE
jgi:2-iminobutanoate/2-iminopropanoate deaminase